MTAAPCSAEHPTYPETHCNRAVNRPHPQHSAYSWDRGRYVSWPNDKYEPTQVQKKAAVKRKEDKASIERRTVLQRIADKIRHS